MYNRKTRYRFYTPNGVPPFSLEDGDDKHKSGIIKDPKKAHTDAPDTTDDDLQNVDKSRGGYGDGSGFTSDKK